MYLSAEPIWKYLYLLTDCKFHVPKPQIPIHNNSFPVHTTGDRKTLKELYILKKCAFVCFCCGNYYPLYPTAHSKTKLRPND